jgi:uncharacterized coiled-coil DUF342 family protein
MEKEFKESIEKSKVAAKELEKKVTEVAGEFSESASEFWTALQDKFEKINVQLAGSYEEIEKAGPEGTLKANLEALEANEKFKEIKESLESFSEKVSKNAQEGFDVVSEKAHLAKKEAENLWEEKSPTLKEEFAKSKEKVTEFSVKAVDEITEFYEKMTAKFNEKKNS